MKRLNCLILIVFFVSIANTIVGQDVRVATPMPDADHTLTELNDHADFGKMMFNLYHNEKIRDELAITKAQFEEINGLYSKRALLFEEEMQKVMNERTIDKRSMGDRRAIGQIARKRVEERALNEIKSVLLPHQIKELEQLAIKEIQKKSGEAGLLQTEWLRDQLGIDDEQMDQIRARANEEMEKLDRKIAELKREAVQNIREELTSKQKEKLMILLGEEK